MKKEKVVITGLGVICSIGADTSDFLESLKRGKNGISELRSIETKDCMTTKGGEVKHIDSLHTDIYGKTLGFTRKAVAEAIEDSGLDLAEQNIGLVLGSSLGNFEFMEDSIFSRQKNQGITTKKDAVNWQKGCLSNLSAAIAEEYSLNGPKVIVSTACAAGTNSLAYAYELIKKGYCSKVITGGADSIYSISLTGFSSLMNVTKDFPRPFDEHRDGLALGEGAGIMIFETEAGALRRNAKIYAEVAGYALGNDAYHVTSPHPEGEGIYRTMLQCIKNSGAALEDVRFVNTHGTGTKANDEMEFKAITRLFKDNSKPVYVSSNKSMFGHCLGAAGSIEAISTVLSIRYGFIPPTINSQTLLKIGENEENTRKHSAIKFVFGEMVETEVGFALSNSAAFAGNLATIGFRKYE